MEWRHNGIFSSFSLEIMKMSLTRYKNKCYTCMGCHWFVHFKTFGGVCLLLRFRQCCNRYMHYQKNHHSCKWTPQKAAGDGSSTRSLSPTWESHIESLDPCFMWPNSSYFRHLGSERAGKRSMFLSFCFPIEINKWKCSKMYSYFNF